MQKISIRLFFSAKTMNVFCITHDAKGKQFYPH